MNIFNELRKHGILAARRHPMYERNRIARLLGYAFGIFWAGYLIILGAAFAFGFKDMVPNWEPYHVMDAIVLPFLLTADFLLRFPFQKTPTQEVKPYLLLPVKRKRLIDFLLLRSGLSLFNLLWLFLFIPFAFFTIPRLYGITGVLTYLIGICLLILINNYWYLLCRTLINERIWWILLPLPLYAGMAYLIIRQENFLSQLFMELGDRFIEGDLLCFAGALATIAALWLVNRLLMAKLIYKEIARTNDTLTRNISEYHFLERYGEVGEYMRLELKMMLRNKRCKILLRNLFGMVLIFSLVLSFSSFYDTDTLLAMICVYNFSAFSLMVLSQIMSFEGNYLDGLMSRRQSILSLLKAKYYVYSLAEIPLFVLMLPAVFTGKLSLLGAFAWAFYSIGVNYFCSFQLAVYNKQTFPLNEAVTSRQVNGGMQIFINLLIYGVPMIVYCILKALIGETITHTLFLTVGIAFTLASPLWIRNIHRRFMKRRYENMEGFRDSRR